MILTNYWKYLNGIQVGGDITGIEDLEGSTFILLGSEVSGDVIKMNTNIGARMAYSNDIVEESDYSLDGDITSSFSNISVVSTLTADDNGIRRIYTIKGTNITQSDIEINRVGLTKLIYGSGLGNGKTILISVVDLNENITVAPNASFSITLEWVEA